MAFEGKQFSHYRILQLISNGNVGGVYLADDLQTQQQVAIKLVRIEALHSNYEAAAEILGLFVREATASTRLDHANILPSFDHGETMLDGSRVAYLVMPYCPEGSLSAWQHQPRRQMTPQLIIHIIRQAGAALQYAHDQQIMHLDVKPTNLLIRSRSTIDEYPNILLSDFGSASLVSATPANQNMPGRSTPYTAPEQYNKQPGFASDQYALGIIAYELLTGKPPFEGEPQKIMSAHLNEQPPLVHELIPLLPPSIDLVLQRALAKKPRKRFHSITEFTQALQAALQEVPTAAYRAVRPASGPPELPGDIYATLTISAQEARDGSIRTLNLPNGRKLHVQIPADTQAEQTLVINIQDEVPEAPKGHLYLTILIPQKRVQIPPATNNNNQMPVTPPPLPLPPIQESRRAKVPLAAAVMLLLLLTVGIISAYSVIAGSRLLPQISQAAPVSASPTTQATASPTNKVGTEVWKSQTSGTTQKLTTVTWTGSQFIVVGSPGVILTSPDGHTWTTQHSGVTQDLWSTAWSGSLLVVVGTGGTVLTSPDGRTWTAQHSGVTQDLWSVSWIDSSLFVAVGTGGTIITSPDGHTWTAQHPSTSTGQILDGIAGSNTLLVVIGNNGTILTSPDDGGTWTPRNTGFTQLFEYIAWSGSQFVIVGANGTILTSPNGNTWTPQPSNVTYNFGSVVWSGSQFAIVGDNGTILTSPNGSTWTSQRSGTAQHLWGIARSTLLFVAVGDHGTIITSP